MKTPEEIAQWVIDNRYPQNEKQKVSDAEMYHNLVDSIANLCNLPVVTHRTCYNCKYCMYESNKPRHEQFTCIGSIDLMHITDPHHHICKKWDE